MATGLDFSPLVCIVDFHHARGPEVEKWFGVTEKNNPPAQNDWSLLPFLALPDGSHASEEELSYFTLQRAATDATPASSLFGIACTRQLDAKELVNRPPDVTRSSVQKAIVAVVDNPYMFARISEKLSAVTKAWFAQKDFSDVAIVESFYESLFATSKDNVEERDQYVGLSLREIIYEYRWQTLVMFKCTLLQPKMLFFGTNCERLCLLQFALISLIPNLIRHLHDCADPSMNSYEETLEIPSSLKTSDRSSLLKYMGLPLQIFGKGSLFGPYTPLQQITVLSDTGTKSYIAGSTNTLLLHQRDRYSDVLVNASDTSISIFSPSLRSALSLSHADRRWIDAITASVLDSWDPANPSRPTHHGYPGSDAFILQQFEEYLLALLASAKYSHHLSTRADAELTNTPDSSPPDPLHDFHPPFVEAWRLTPNFVLFNKTTTADLFDVVDPKHPSAGGLTIDDIQRRMAQQVRDLQIEERLAPARAVLNERLDAGQKRMAGALVGLRNEYETRRKQFDERRAASASSQNKTSEEGQEARAADEKEGERSTTNQRAVEMRDAAAQNIQAAGARASAYFSSWGSWAAEKKKNYYAQREDGQAGTQRRSLSGTASAGGAGNSGGATGAKVMTVWRMSAEEQRGKENERKAEEQRAKENEKKVEEEPVKRNFERGYDTVEDY